MTSIILEVKLDNICYNYNYLRKVNKEGITAAVVKGDAYGLGINKISQILYKQGCNNFFVATIEEGIELRTKYKKVNIFVLNGVNSKEIKNFLKYKIIPVINNIKQFKLIKRLNKKISIILHYDTGMNRLGLNINEIKLIKNLIKYSKIKLLYIMSHLSSAEKTFSKTNNKQIMKFKKVLSIFKNHKLSLSNSSGIFLSYDFHFQMTRPGISLYGGYGNISIKKYIKPVIKLKAQVIQIKKINVGDTIGYNETYKLKTSKYIATVAIGYADGIPRNLSNNGYVYYKKYKANIIGNISMDTLVIDINNFYNKIKIGHYVELINYRYDIENFAKQAKTVSQDILTSFGRRVKIRYV